MEAVAAPTQSAVSADAGVGMTDAAPAADANSMQSVNNAEAVTAMAVDEPAHTIARAVSAEPSVGSRRPRSPSQSGSESGSDDDRSSDSGSGSGSDDGSSAASHSDDDRQKPATAPAKRSLPVEPDHDRAGDHEEAFYGDHVVDSAAPELDEAEQWVQAAERAGFPAHELIDLEKELFGQWISNDEEKYRFLDLRNWQLCMWQADMNSYLSVQKATKDASDDLVSLARRVHGYLEQYGYINSGILSPKLHPSVSQPSSSGTGSSSSSGSRYAHPLAPRKRILVLGAGMSGACAARQLRAFGHEVIVLEARSRIGGRVCTSRKFDNAAVDLGASIITGLVGNPLATIVKQSRARLHRIESACPLFAPNGQPLDTQLDSRVEAIFNILMQATDRLRGAVSHREEQSLKTEIVLRAGSLRKSVWPSVGLAPDSTTAALREAPMSNGAAAASAVTLAAIADVRAPQNAELNADAAVTSDSASVAPMDVDQSATAASGAAAPTASGRTEGSETAKLEDDLFLVRVESNGVSVADDVTFSAANKTGRDPDSTVKVTLGRLLNRVTAAAHTQAEKMDLAAGLHAISDMCGFHLTKEEQEVFNWHLANLDYGCATPVRNVSLVHWDQDDPYGFSGDHLMLPDGYSPLVQAVLDAADVQVHMNTTVLSVQYRDVQQDAAGVTPSGDAVCVTTVETVPAEADTISYPAQPVPESILGARSADSTRRIKVWKADAVVVTLPLGVLKAGAVQFDPPLPAWKQAAIDRLGFGNLNKVVLQFDRCFWGKDKTMFGSIRPLESTPTPAPAAQVSPSMNGQNAADNIDSSSSAVDGTTFKAPSTAAPFVRQPGWRFVDSGAARALDFTTAAGDSLDGSADVVMSDASMDELSRKLESELKLHRTQYGEAHRGAFYMFWSLDRCAGKPVLVGLNAGVSSYRMDWTEHSSAVDQALGVLREIFGSETVPDPVNTHVTRWSRDPFSLGTYSYVAAGASGEDYDALARPVSRTVFFAGEATTRYYPATVAGAYASGLRVAGRMEELDRRWSNPFEEIRRTRRFDVPSLSLDRPEPTSAGRRHRPASSVVSAAYEQAQQEKRDRYRQRMQQQASVNRHQLYHQIQNEDDLKSEMARLYKSIESKNNRKRRGIRTGQHESNGDSRVDLKAFQAAIELLPHTMQTALGVKPGSNGELSPALVQAVREFEERQRAERERNRRELADITRMLIKGETPVELVRTNSNGQKNTQSAARLSRQSSAASTATSDVWSILSSSALNLPSISINVPDVPTMSLPDVVSFDDVLTNGIKSEHDALTANGNGDRKHRSKDGRHKSKKHRSRSDRKHGQSSSKHKHGSTREQASSSRSERRERHRSEKRHKSERHHKHGDPVTAGSSTVDAPMPQASAPAAVTNAPAAMVMVKTESTATSSHAERKPTDSNYTYVHKLCLKVFIRELSEEAVKDPAVIDSMDKAVDKIYKAFDEKRRQASGKYTIVDWVNQKDHKEKATSLFRNYAKKLANSTAVTATAAGKTEKIPTTPAAEPAASSPVVKMGSPAAAAGGFASPALNAGMLGVPYQAAGPQASVGFGAPPLQGYPPAYMGSPGPFVSAPVGSSYYTPGVGPGSQNGRPASHPSPPGPRYPVAAHSSVAPAHHQHQLSPPTTNGFSLLQSASAVGSLPPVLPGGVAPSKPVGGDSSPLLNDF